MHEPDDVLLTPEEEGVREALRDLPPPEAQPAFRNRLRREFATGQFQPRPQPVLPKATEWFTWRWATPATAILLLIAFAFLNRGADWRILSASGAGSAIVNGTTLSLADAPALERALRRGGHVSVPEGSELTLVTPGTLLVQVAPNTDMTLPEPPGRWFGKRMKAAVNRGEGRLLTGSRFPGHVLEIDSPVGRTVVTGTVVSVVTDGTFTCVCVTEGKVQAGKTPTTMEVVSADMRKVMFADERPSVIIPIETEHAAGLETLLREHGRDIDR